MGYGYCHRLGGIEKFKVKAMPLTRILKKVLEFGGDLQTTRTRILAVRPKRTVNVSSWTGVVTDQGSMCTPIQVE